MPENISWNGGSERARGDSPSGAEAGRPSVPSALSAGPDAPALLRALRRRWLLASGLGLVAAAVAAAAAWYLMPVRYTARALLYVSATPPSVVFSSTENRADFAIYQRTQLALVKSRPVINTALKQPKVKDLDMVNRQADQIEWLKGLIKPDFSAGPEIMNIGITCGDPEAAAVLANAVAQGYLSEIVEEEKNKRHGRLDELKKVLSKFDTSLQFKRKAFKEMAQPLGSGNPQNLDLKQRFAQEQLARTEQELLQRKIDLQKLEVDAKAQEAGERAVADLPIRDRDLEGYFRQDPGIAKLLDRKARAEAALVEHQRVLKLGDVRLKQDRDDIASVEADLKARRDELRPQAEAELRQMVQDKTKAAHAELQERIAVLKAFNDKLNAEAERLRNETRSLGQGAVNIEDYRQEIDQLGDVTKRVGNEVERLTVELDAPSRVRLLEDAVAPPGQDRKQKLMAAGGTGGVALALVVLLVAWLEFRCRRVGSVEEVVQGLGMYLMGTLPALPRGRGRLLERGSANHWYSRLTESVDAARTMLLHASRQQSLRVVMVTSAVGGEGKTSLSSHLAASLARSGRNTVLVDCDFRNPSVHRLFEVAAEPGLSEVLRGEVELEQALYATAAEGLSVLPAGRCDPDVLQALSQEEFPNVFEELKQRFDFILIDSCPVLPVVDALLFAQHVDGVIFSVLHEVSRLPDLYAAYQRLSVLGTRILGVAVSGTREAVAHYGYQYVRPVTK
jgi:succinoglycan biosynthesis transport protein ExoP